MDVEAVQSGQRATSVSAPSGSRQIHAVQAHRALAALAVVAFHSTVLWQNKAALGYVSPWENGNAGVDLFFVISGFIIVLSSRSLATRRGGWRTFIELRLIRLVPMYWLATAAKDVAVTAAPGMALHTHASIWNTVASFLFVPSYNAEGVIAPLLPVGWTLSFEMLFYMVFALALFSALDAVMFVAPIMMVLALVSGFMPKDWPAFTSLADPLVLEFVLGMLVARAFLSRRLQAIPSCVAIPLGLAGLLCLAVVPTHGNWQRCCFWGIPASVTLTACLAMEAHLTRIMPRLLIKLGEASYSLYLTHGFFLPVIGMVVFKIGLSPEEAGMTLMSSCLIISSVASLLVYRFVEVPLTRGLRHLLTTRRPTADLELVPSRHPMTLLPANVADSAS